MKQLHPTLRASDQIHFWNYPVTTSNNTAKNLSFLAGAPLTGKADPVPDVRSEDKAVAYKTVVDRALKNLRHVADCNPFLPHESKATFFGLAMAIAAAIRERKATSHSELADIIGEPSPIQAEPSAGPIDNMAAQTQQILEAEYLDQQMRASRI